MTPVERKEQTVDSSTILFLILVIAAPLAMMWMHRGGGHGAHGGSGGGCGRGHSHGRKDEPAGQEADVRRGHAGH